MMKRYLPVIFTIFAVTFTQTWADHTMPDPDFNGNSGNGTNVEITPGIDGGGTGGGSTTICTRNILTCPNNNETMKTWCETANGCHEVYTCGSCPSGYATKTKTDSTCKGTSYISCEKEQLDCTGKCSSCNSSTGATGVVGYNVTANKACEQSGSSCVCNIKSRAYSCAKTHYQSGTSATCSYSSGTYGNCSGCTICPTNATCDGSKTFTCKSGYYKSDSSCKACPANSTCTSATNFTCNNGYYKSGSGCASCPSNATCTNGTDFTCNNRYYKSGSGCVACPQNSTCTSATNFTCNDGYYKSGSGCASCPSNATCTNGTDFTCTSGYYKSGNSCKSCGSITIGDKTITATSEAGATSKSDCAFTNVNTDISEVKFYPNKEDTLNYHEATIKIKSCY